MGRRSRNAYRQDEESEQEQENESEEEQEEPKSRNKRLRRGRDKAENAKSEKQGKATQGKGQKGKATPSRGQGQQPWGFRSEAPQADIEAYEQQVDFYITDSDTVVMPGKISIEERDKVVREVMRLMLFKQHSKADQPVRRQEISDRINAVTAHRPASLGSYVIKQAQRKFAEVMGLEMKEVELKAHINHGKGKSRLGGGSSTSNAYVLRSLLPAAIREKYVEAGTVQYDKGFAMVVFSLLSTNAGKIAEGDLWAYLEDLGVAKGEVHPVFGKPELQLETMEKQKYVYRTKGQGSDGGEVLEYYLGDNALDEMRQDASVKEWLAEMFSDKRTRLQQASEEAEAL